MSGSIPRVVYLPFAASAWVVQRLVLLAHRQVGRAVAAMLDDPARNWTLDELAARANASRASLVRMFQRTAQLAPLTFLPELRLELARRKLSATMLPIAAIGGEVGYKSESAFSRAFQRRFGVRPSAAHADTMSWSGTSAM